MKIAAISDIHSNVFALEAVLDDIRKRGADVIVNLGDIFYGPIAPRATYELLIEEEIITIAGNQDRQIYESMEDEIRDNVTLQFVLAELDGAPLDWLQLLPKEMQLTADVYLCHGAPGNDSIYFLEDIENGSGAVRTDAEIIALLHGQSAPLILCGHTHIPRTVALSTSQLIVNPGSVGLPAYEDDLPVVHKMENYSAHASYALLEKKVNGWLVEQFRIPYDVEAACKKALLLERHDWVAYLQTGRG